MKDHSKDADKKPADKQEQKEEEPQDQYYELKKNLVLLEKAAIEKDFRQTGVLTKNLKKIRHALSLPDALLILKFYLPDLFNRLKLSAQPTQLEAGVKIEEHLHCTQARAEQMMKFPETQLFIYIVLQMKLVDDGDFTNAKDFSDFIFLRLNLVNRRTIDPFQAKAIYFMALAYEKVGKLHTIRPQIYESFKSSCLHLDTVGQATMMNIIIRSYLQQNLYEQARNFISKTTFPENSNNS
jgi:26S proteasome regulatory subunit N3